jgi:hypothetical protein
MDRNYSVYISMGVITVVAASYERSAGNTPVLFVCVCVCMYVCMYRWEIYLLFCVFFVRVCVYVFVYDVCMYVCMHACINVCMYRWELYLLFCVFFVRVCSCVCL